MTNAVELIKRWVTAAPDKTALICGDRAMTYGEMWQAAGELAASLRGQRVGTGDVVALYGPGTPEFVVAALGVWRSGAAYVPIDPQLPGERLEFILADSGARTVINTGTRKALATNLPLADVAALRAGATDAPVDTRPDPADLAYIIYTSGSTGTPKGVCVEHGPLGIHLVGIAIGYEYEGDDISLSFSSPSFDTSIEEIWMPLSLGAGIVMRGAAMWTGPQLFERIRAHGITRVQSPTAFFESFFADELTDADVEALATVRGIYFGGEAVNAAIVRRWSHGRLGHIPLYNTYGPTEAVVTASSRRIDAGWDGGDRVPIGTVIPGHELLLLDDDGQEAVPGQPAELYLGGPCVARGYLGRADLTAQRFVRLPGREGVFYRTGDLVCVDGGELLFLGRVDRQVKLRGFRIELEEIEAALVALPEVRNAVVALDAGPNQRPRLTAYVVPRVSGSTENFPDDFVEDFTAGLRRQLAGRLPAYMVPERILVLPELPVSATGKIDRQRVLATAGGAR